ncbi:MULTISPECIES: sugar ABC transporter permease [Paenarthrobacter]|jgi:multiple sugar transport system permease protein|uniref:Multiple sugar transport system permease protein n=1 Tax=Paenarthrobacter nicotinovorans TaxID=29320 RepID=A0ABT9TJ49_PAENI|nr:MULTISPECIES: sugar ABC transporter permease [Paenarthrobacter]KIA71736.1 ABC-type sugar transport system, permease component [Arthrobacter sp. MWB30]KQR05891.1 ABC transporter permease [Arthrobacter sp. Leaf145]SKB41412.1 carbohydrate ABC transporter membrane protein 1, CUT1 family [Arthrobacter sp. 31Cvi3.1E]BCW11950.1 ABC transporter permease [Arthrobacter sp. NtRootA2]BCW16034.1 ABC transporter permease [Arthrobacter sp. NtRootA4]BCW24367.1 ABC transporter permease [Arthrobacter sp. Nt
MSAIGELSTMTRRKGPMTKEEKKANGRDNKAAYVFLLPWLLGLAVITVGPMLMSLYLSFTDYNLLQPPEWVGLDNFVRMFGDARLHNSLRVTFTYVLVGVPLQLAVALVIALVLDKGLRGLPFYRSIFYLPSLLGGSVAVAILWKQIFGTTGLVNQVLAMIGIEGPGWISDPNTALGSIILLHVWTFGSPMIIFLAGLRQIPVMYYEAAKVDGATTLQQFWRITLPMLSPIIFFNLVLQIIGSFQSFTQAFIVSGGNGGPSDSTMFFTLYLYQKGFGQFDMGYASAMAWFLLVIIGVFTAINFIASKYWVFYDD